MMNRQKKRAENIIRCHKNIRMIKLILAENSKIEKIEKEFLLIPDLKFITYDRADIIIIDGITRMQGVKIEYDFLLSEMERAKITLEDYHNHLDALLDKIVLKELKND
jgi:hypothetical protein